MRAASGNDLGLRLIVGYKLAKGAAQSILGVVGLSRAAALTADLRRVAHVIRAHAVEAWSVKLAERLLSIASDRTVRIAALALLLDGVVSFVEGWALHRRYWWSDWLVVAATAALLPIEARAIVHHATIGRAVLIVLNALIVAYLLARRLRRRAS
jgi:uncharacterized membrane protein (DUF2068 family)